MSADLAGGTEGNTMKYLKNLLLGFVGTLAIPTGGQAGPLPTFPNAFDPVPYISQGGCVVYGDFISCSAGMLNYLNGLDVTQKTTESPSGYVIQISQGFLDQILVLGTGSGGQKNNQDLFGSPDPAAPVDNAFDTPNAPPLWSTKTEPEPIPSFTGDHTGTWDISANSLVSLLTSGGAFHELLIGFDHNQQGSGEDQTINAWAVVSIVDNKGTLATGDDTVVASFELTDAGADPGFVTPFNALGSGPVDPARFIQSFAFICVNESTNTVTPQNDNCPNDPNVVEISNNLGTNVSEFLVFIPELSQLLLNCFNTPANCTNLTVTAWYEFSGANDGFEDLFVLAGRELTTTQVNEPGTLAIVAIGLLGLAYTRRRYGRRLQA